MALLETLRVPLALAGAGLVFVAIYAALGRVSQPSPLGGEGLRLDAAVSDVKRALQAVADAPGTRLGLVLDEAVLTLAVDAEDDTSGTATLTVPVFDSVTLDDRRRLTSAETSTVTVALAAPTARQVLSADDAQRIDISALVLAVRAQLATSLAGEPRLDAKRIEVALRFVLVRERDRSAGVSVRIVSARADGRTARSSSSEIKLVYVNPVYADEGRTGGAGGALAPP